jgi:integrase/recombinase XerD
MEKAIFEFMFSTGCRIEEIVALEKNHINRSNQSAIVGGKGDKEREVYFNTHCDIWLKRYIESRNDNNPAIFVTVRQPHKMSVALMQYIIKRISKRAEINKKINPHQLRHGYATHLLNNGAPIAVIHSPTGHEKSETTRIYAQLSGSVKSVPPPKKV